MTERIELTCSLTKPWYCAGTKWGGETSYHRITPLMAVRTIERGYGVAAIVDKPHAVILYPATTPRTRLEFNV